ncbi:uncharacterized protein LOC109022060 [Juglans regia]|uniref:Uncharacterized protein LOC109022060 n=1 Tax=Juglans regia TaxID=51240 RepID=A0A6P9EW19_JUGRE|nr:uncharacterized protein LOC109022060 [Juglans regia]
MKGDADQAKAADLRLSASGRNAHSQQVNSPTITTTTTTDVICGSTSDPVKGGEKKLGIQNDGEFSLEDEENLKSKGTLPVINWSAGSKDSLQDQTKNGTFISNYDETTGHGRDELMKEADLETGNKRVPATFRKQTRKQRRKHRRRRSLESKELGDDNYITKGDELKEVDHLETENKWVPSSFDLGSLEEKELGIQDEENRKSKGRLPVINWSAGSKDSIQDETKNDTYISNYDETTGQERDELMKEADLETGNKRVPATFGKQTRKQLRSSHKRRRSLESKAKELGDDNYITKGDELKEVDHLETENKWVPSSFDLGSLEGRTQSPIKNHLLAQLARKASSTFLRFIPI